MSLVVDVYNKSNNKQIAPGMLLMDDNFELIKAKLFYFTDGIEMHPSFIKLEKEDGSIHTPSIELDTNKLYVTNILDTLEKDYNVPMLYQMFENNEYTETFTDITISKGYINFTEEDFEFAIKVTLLKSSPSLFGHFQTYVEEYLEKLLNSKPDLQEHFENLQNYYSAVSTTNNLYTDSIKYNQISIILSEKENKQRFVKIMEIFNSFPLSKEFPFIAIESNGIPMVKVFNNLLDFSSEKDVKSWLLNEKKKAKQVRYKKIKGLMFKIYYTNKFFTAHLFENGSVILKAESLNSDYDSLVTSLKNIHKKITSILNSASNEYGYFTKSHLLSSFDNMVWNIETLTASVDSSTLIDRNSFSKELYNPYLSEYVFKLKDTIAEDMMSMYYVKSNITVNVKDNPYKINSSIITIYGAQSVFQVRTILHQIHVINNMSETDTNQRQKVKEKSHIKNLRQQGVNILSTKCQKPRQPVLETSDVKPLKNSYILEHKGKKYVCPKKDYPYPGFTNENIICCFKKDQRRRDAYIRNTASDDLEVLVQPSNFKIDVMDNGQRISTFAIKVVSEYMDGLDEQNSVSKFYYLSKDNTLVAITNNDVIDILNDQEQQDSTIWLETVPLTKLITNPPKNKCNFAPDFSKPNIHNKCEHHERNKYFGYNLNSYPCCFDKEREATVTRKRKEIDITKQHIIKSDKILDYQRIGMLPDALHNILDNTYYRMGVVQNKSAFFNAVLLALQHQNSTKLKTTTELKKELVNLLEKDSELFAKLNGGSVALKYKEINNYIETLKSNNVIHWSDTIDLIMRELGVNVFILNIPYLKSESTQTPDYNNMKIICTPFITYDNSKPFLILLKRQNAFEIIIKLDNGDVTTLFTQNDSLSQLFMDYVKMSCVKENEYPSAFVYDLPYDINQVLSILKETKHKLVGQVVNSFNKVEMVITKKAFLIPVQETGLVDNLNTVPLDNLLTSNSLNDIETFQQNLKEINKEFSKNNLIPMSVRGYTHNDSGAANALLFNVGSLIPIQESMDVPNTFTKLPFSFYKDVDKYLQTKDTIKNSQDLYSEKIESTHQEKIIVKRFLAKYISKNEKAVKYIENVITKPKLSQFDKIQMLVDMFNKLFNQISQDKQPNVTLDKNFLFRVIAKEVLNEGANGNFINNIVLSNSNKNNISSRTTESILLNLEDIKKWISQHNRENN